MTTPDTDATRRTPSPSRAGLAEQPKGQLLFGVVRIVLAFFLLLVAAHWLPGVSERPVLVTVVMAGASLPFLLAIALSHAGRQLLAERIAVVNLTAGAMVSVASFGGLHGPIVYALPLSIAIVGLLRGRRAAWLAGFAHLLFALAEARLELAGLAPFVAPLLGSTATLFGVVGGVGMAVALITLYTREVGIARRQAAESTARANASEHDLADLVRLSPDGIAVLDSNGVIEIVNDSMAQLSGKPAAALIGLGLADLPGMAALDAREAVLEGLARLHERGEALWNLTFQHADGRTVPVEVHASRLRRADGTRRVQLVLRDMSFRVDVERERARLEGELREARRVEGLGRLAGGVAHDFRNLLTPILVNAGLLEQGRTTPQALELAQEIGLAGERANALIQQLLAFARRQDLELRAMDLNQVVLGIEPLLRRLVPADVRLQVSLAADLGALNGDRTQLEQVIVNLVANARDALRPAGTIRIETANTVVTPAEAARHPARRAGPCIALSVADDGVGMTEEVRGRLFEPFFSTKGPDRGTGLGLATVHGVVSQLGGAIDVESAPGRGTTFRILLPRLDADGAALPALALASAPTPIPAGRASRILVVDDDDLVRGALVRTLRRAGHAVTEARAGAEAIEIARRAGPPFDLLVTDLVMPIRTGNDVARELRALRACRRVLFISGYAEHPALRAAHALPESGFLQKPFSGDTLLASVATLLAA